VVNAGVTTAGAAATDPGAASFVKTVERHRTNLMNKLVSRDRAGLTRYAIRRGLVEP
jgi:FixJ family two-component response regulator